MGDWGYRNFENDRAMDFVGDFQDMPSEVVLLEALTIVLEAAEEEENIESGDASAALAAAEIVAASLGKPGGDFPADLASALTHLDLGEDSELQEMAQDAVAAILKSSELKELWEDGDGLAPWQAAQEDLLARLQ